MSAIALVAFYLLLRQLKVRPTAALLGAATLGCNPLVVFLSYSFMTDVTFLAFMLLACLFFLKGLEKNNVHWLVLGSIFSGFAYLDRQYGILIVVALLLSDGGRTRGPGEAWAR